MSDQGASGAGGGGPVGVRPWVPGALLLLVLALAVGLRSRPPGVVPASADGRLFSAERAVAVLGRVLGDGRPHPVGSAANEEVALRLVAELEELGLEVETWRRFSCGADDRACAPVTDLLARSRPPRPGPVLLLVAHYDSVPAGPGAGDDGAGVAAILEVARALSDDPGPGHSVAFLLTDGEETGLLGAEAFAREHPLLASVSLVINLEARGTTGLALLFETSEGNEWLIEAYRDAVPRPAASSLFYELYRLLPIDTDFSAFRRAGVPGVNLAFVEGVERYHTERDDLRHLDPRAVQHLGETALPLARRLAGTGRPAGATTDAVYGDLLGYHLVVLPVAWVLPLGICALSIASLAAFLLRRRRLLSIGGLVLGLVGWLGAVGVAAGLGFATTFVLAALGEGSRPWLGHPLPTRVAIWACGVLAVVAVLGPVSRRAGPWSGAAAAGLVWSGLSLGLGTALPGASILTLPVALGAGLGLLVGALGLGRRPVVADLLGGGAAGLFWWPLVRGLEHGFGLEAGIAIAAVVAAVVATASGISSCPPRMLRWSALLVLFSASMATFLPEATSDRPARVNVTYSLDADRGVAHWLVGYPGIPVPLPMRRAAGLSQEPVQQPFPWSGPASRTWAGAAPVADLAPPEVELTGRRPGREGGETLSLRLISPRGARVAFLFLPEDATVRAARVEGEGVGLSERRGYRAIRVDGVPTGGVAIELDRTGGGPFALFVADRSDDLPAAGGPIVEVRPRWAVESQQGDTSVVYRRVEVDPTGVPETPDGGEPPGGGGAGDRGTEKVGDG